MKWLFMWIQVQHFGVWSIPSGACAIEDVANRPSTLTPPNCSLTPIWDRCRSTNTRYVSNTNLVKCDISKVGLELKCDWIVQVGGYLSNMGQGVVFTVDNMTRPNINLTGGPLSYKYEFHQITLHFGLTDHIGSEHTIAGRSFPAEVCMSNNYFNWIKIL